MGIARRYAILQNHNLQNLTILQFAETLVSATFATCRNPMKVSAIVLLLAIIACGTPAYAIDANVTRIDFNSASGALSAFVRSQNDGNLTIDFNVSNLGGTNYLYADLYYSRIKKRFENQIFNDLNLMGLRIADSNPIGYWRFDGNNGFDYFNRGNNARDINATYDYNGKFGGAFSFVPGDQNGIQILDSTSLDINGRLSLVAWVYMPATTSDSNNFVCKGNNYCLSLSSGIPQFQVYGGDGSVCTLTATGKLTANRWHQVVGTLNSGGGFAFSTLFIDGDSNVTSSNGLCNSLPAQGLAMNDLNLTIGGIRGMIDEVMVFDRILSATEALMLYDQNNLWLNNCVDLNFSDSTKCIWDWDVSSAADGNYFVDINVWSALDANYANSSDSNLRVFQNPSLDINVVALDGFSDTNAGNIFSYYGDRNVTIDFNFSVLSGVWNNPIVSIYYSAARNGKENAVFADTIRLLDAGRCADTNFLDSTKCSWDWNIHRSLVIDGNYFIDINLTDDIFTDENSTDQNFQIDNNAPVPNADYNAFWVAADQNVKLYCSIDANWDIAATNDDCYIPSDNTAVCSSVQAWGDATSLGFADLNGYYRWALDIPVGSQIFSAAMQEKAYAGCGGAPYSSYCASTGYTIRIELMDADNQGAFNSGSPWNVATAASVNYSLTSAWIAGTWYSSPDLNTFLKSFVSRSGYAVGNYIGIRYSHNNVADNKLKFADSFDNESAPAKLLATYGVGTGQKDCSNIKYRLDTDDTNTVSFGAWQAYNSTVGVPITSDGNWAIDINVTDRAKNMSDTNRVYILIDKSISITSPGTGQVLSSTYVTFSYSASSKISPVNAYWVKLDNQALYTNNGTSTTYSTTLDSGSHTFYVMANGPGDVNSPAASVSFTINLGAGSAQCGDGVCGSGETAANCAADCPPVCGDNACTGTETSETCAADCVVGCGDNICDPDAGETCSTCASDCGECAPGEEQIPAEETVLEQTQTAQATVQQIEDVLRDVGFTVSEIEAAKEASTKMSIARTITVEKKAAEEGASESYSSQITLAVTNTTSGALKNVRIVEVIPKSVANTSDEVTSARPFAVLKSDPVMQFSISEIPSGGTSEVKYSLAKKLTEEQIADYAPPVPAYAIEAAEATCANVKCDDKNPCTDDLCFDGECAYVYAKDGTTCGFGRECAQGVCRGLALSTSIAGGFGFDMQTILVIVVVLAAVAIAAGMYIKRRK